MEEKRKGNTQLEFCVQLKDYLYAPSVELETENQRCLQELCEKNGNVLNINVLVILNLLKNT